MSTKINIPRGEADVTNFEKYPIEETKEFVQSAKPVTSEPVVQVCTFSMLDRLVGFLQSIGVAMGSRTKLIICCVGIFVCYFYYGILQEKITRSHYGHGDSQERFTCTISLVFLQCVINAAFAKLLVHIQQSRSRQVGGVVSVDRTSSGMYAACSLSYLLAMLSSNHALQHVNYPTQVVGKACKPIPVMVLGVALAGKRYPLSKYLYILMIVLGVSLFMYKDTKAAQHVADEHVIGIGEALLLFSLSMDGVTGAIQERMRSQYSTSGNHMMYNMNYWSTVYLAAGELFTGEVFEFISFVHRYPLVLFNIITFGLASALGQFFIFMTVSEFGPLVCSIVTTTRKFFTVLASVFFFGNTLIARQWFGTSLVFAGLSLDAAYGKASKKPSPLAGMDQSEDGDLASAHKTPHHRAPHHHHDRHHHGHRHHSGGDSRDLQERNLTNEEVDKILDDLKHV